MTSLSYNQFRAALKGTPQKEISEAWKLYKNGEYHISTGEAPTVEPPAPKKAAPKKAAAKKAAKEEKDKLALCNLFLTATEELARKPWLFSEVEKEKVLDKLTQIAKNTIPKGYTCSPSDSWKLWFGPTSECLLINTTNQMAFKITRTWWQREYNNTIYVDRELLKDNKLIELEKMRYARMGKYVPRNPIPGLECKLPQGVKDITVHGGQAGGR